MARSLDIATPLGPDAFVLVGLSGREQISTLSEFSLRLKSKLPDISANKMLGQNVTVRVELDAERANRFGARYFNGYVTSWRGVTEIRDSLPGQNQTKAYLYEGTVHPWLWFLTRQSNSRIFQDKTVPQIVEAVFREYKSLASFTIETSGRFPMWEFCCQYRETDFNFVSRLLEQEGIYYYVTHENGKHTVTLVNSSSAHTSHLGYEVIRYDEGERPGEQTLQTWQGQHDIQPGRYAVNDYNPLTPKAKLSAFAERAAPHPYGAFEFFDHPAEYGLPADGEFYSKIRLDELHAQRHTFTGAGSIRGTQPGSVFTLDRHPVAAFNEKYLVVGATYSATGNAQSSGSGAGFSFESSISAIAFTQQYRPPRVTPKPLAQGPQTAVVVGPTGEEIHTDVHGRIKVQFRWDRYGKANQNSSCWMRVVQPWAGNGYGAFALPRVGQEVVVEFLEGDPDWPIVSGSVYNADNRPPYALPAEKTRWGLKSRSTKGGGPSNFNELRFEDKSGAEEVYLHAEKDQTLYTKNKRTEFVGGQSHLQIDADAFSKLGADDHTHIQGDELLKVGGGVHLTVGEDWQAKVGKKLAAEAGQEIHLKAGATLVLEAGARLSLKVGGNFIDINPAGVFIKGALVMVNSGGSAGTGSGASPDTPKSAAKAHDSKGGKDQPITQKAAALISARAAATPFCEICDS